MSEGPLLYPGSALRDWLQKERGVSLPEEHLNLLTTLADTLFFASLGKEEGDITRVRLVYHPRGIAGLEDIREHVLVGSAHSDRRAWETIPFAHQPDITSLSVKALIKIAPIANLPRTSIVVGVQDGQVIIQGLARRVEYEHLYETNENDVLVFHAPEPGYLILSINGEEVFRYEQGRILSPARRVRLDVLLFNTSSMVNAALMQICASLRDELAEPLLQLPGTKNWHISQIFYKLVWRMGEMRHGGLIAILPDTSQIEKFRSEGKYRLPQSAGTVLRTRLKEYVASESIYQDLLWKRTTASTPESDEEVRDKAIAHQDKEHDKEELDALVDTIGQLTAVDNALLLGPNLEVICAGYPIPTQREEKLLVYEAESLLGEPGAPYVIGQHGSRHRAAAFFANRHPGGLVFVASQDGPLRCLHRPLGQEEILLWNLRIPYD